jgi:hypothetical protein
MGPEDREQILGLLAAHPDWSRRRLSQELCRVWNWRNGVGQIKDMAARSLLVKLEHKGLIQLPARRQMPSNRMRDRQLPALVWDPAPIEGPLGCLVDLQVQEISPNPEKRAEFAAALAQFHYLGSGGTVGENLQYRVCSVGRPLAYLLFGSSAWKCRDRDGFIGWNAQQRERNLNLTTNNARFLILPWVKVPHLASWILGRVMRRLSQDWQGKYGHRIVLVETFVERERFRGTAYRAANWIKVGATIGRTRQDRRWSIRKPVKEIYVYALQENFRQQLCQ